MKSMTGFGYAEYQDEKHQVALSLKSYNNRFLDIFVYLPQYLSQLEQRIREYLASRILRGRVELTLTAVEFEQGLDLILDKSSLAAYVNALRELIELAGIDEKLRLSHLLKMEGLFKKKKIQGREEYWQFLKPLLDSAYRSFEQMRLREGKATQADIRHLLSAMESDLDDVEAQASRIEIKIKEDLRTRFFKLLGDGVDETRVLAETAVMLMKFDINEELVRIRSHLSHFHRVLMEDGALGKKLDFICQELNREVNTIGAKSLVLEIDKAVISLKDSLERIREQLRNVE